VLFDWKYLGGYAASGVLPCTRAILSYLTIAGVVVLCRMVYISSHGRETYRPLGEDAALLPAPSKAKRNFAALVLPALAICAIPLLPAYPWQEMTRTLPFDVTCAIVKNLVGGHAPKGQGIERVGSTLFDIFGPRNYSPNEDPYYISNLDQPIDEFISQAIEDLHVTNIVHIFLESMRGDSFPFQDDGLLSEHLHNSPRVNISSPIDTHTMTPFIASLAEHTISWQSMWTTAPFTHKALISRMLPVEHRLINRPLWHAPSTSGLECGSKRSRALVPGMHTRGSAAHQSGHQ